MKSVMKPDSCVECGPSDLPDEERERIAPLMPSPGRRGRPREGDFREVINAVRYPVRSGCGWRMAGRLGCGGGPEILFPPLVYLSRWDCTKARAIMQMRLRVLSCPRQDAMHAAGEALAKKRQQYQLLAPWYQLPPFSGRAVSSIISQASSPPARASASASNAASSGSASHTPLATKWSI
jgi:transposase